MKRITRFAKKRKTEAAPMKYQSMGQRRINRFAAKYRKGYDRVGGFYGRYNKRGDTESKFFDTNVSFNFDATGEVPATGQLTLIPQGVTESQRIGRKCTITSMQFKGHFSFAPAAAAQASGIAYFYVILDTQCNGAAAAITDCFTSTNLSIALRNLANNQRFRILKKIVMSFTSPAGVTTAYNSIAKPVSFYKKCNIPIEYSSTTGALTEIKSNNIFLIAGSAQFTDDLITAFGNFRLRFTG